MELSRYVEEVQLKRSDPPKELKAGGTPVPVITRSSAAGVAPRAKEVIIRGFLVWDIADLLVPSL